MYLALPKTDWLMLLILFGTFVAKAETNNTIYTDTLHVNSTICNYIVEINEKSPVFVLKGLKPGANYNLGLRTGNEPIVDKFLLELRPEQTEVLTKSASSINFNALQKQLDFTIKNPQNIAGNFTLIIEKNEATAEARFPPGIETDPDFSAQELIEDIFIGGACFEIVDGSIQTIGSAMGMGFFSGGTSSIGVESGVILASGQIENAEGPNNNNNETGWLDGQGDADLDEVGTGDSEDAVGIEFEFVPTTDMVEFTYVFASEEYCQYVNTGFNDVFGFFISGPGINGPHTNNAINIATVPGTNSYVSINTINKFQNSAYYMMNERQFEASGCGYTVNQVAPTEIQYDGFTTPLTAIANVIPCETYKIRLVIADVGDQLLDSGVFLAANSFNASGGTQISAMVPVTGTNEAYEVCDGAYFLFERENEDLSQDHVININIDPASTATAGLDYETLPSSIVIPAGESSVVLPVNVLNDNLAEGNENLRLILDQPCTCENNSAELIILDSDPLVVELEDMSSCIGTTFDVAPEVSGGLPGYTFSWNDGATHTDFQVTPDSDVSYSLTVTDMCGNIVVEEVNIAIDNGPVAALSGDGQLCNGDAGTEFLVEFTGYGPWDLTYAFNGQEILLSNITENPYPLQVQNVGVYNLVDVVSLGCDGNVAMNAIELSYTTVELDYVATATSCYEGADGTVDLTVAGGNGSYTFAWSNNETSEDINALTAGNYLVTVTDEIGCSALASIDVPDGVEVVTEVLFIQEVDCYGNQSGAIDIDVSGGVGNFNFLWNNNAVSEDLENIAAGDYSLTVSDGNGCSAVANINIPEPAPLVATATQLTIANCLNPSGGSVDLNVEGGTLPYSFAWSTNETTEDIQSLPQGDYIVNVTDANNCLTSAIVSVDGDFEAPVFDFETPEILTCKDTVISLAAMVENEGEEHEYNWTTSEGNILLFENTAAPEVNAPGMYNLLVTDTSNGCTTESEIEVTENVVAPTALASSPFVINCFANEVAIDGSNSSQGENMSYLWSTTDGQIEEGDTGLSPVVSIPAAYSLLVTDEENGCTATTEIVVEADLAVPVVEIELPAEINCYNNSILLDAQQSDDEEMFEAFWSTGNGEIVEGQTTLTPEVAAEGIYTLTILNTANGCVGTNAISVYENFTPPIVDAGETQELNCYNPELNLNANADGVDVVFQWTGPDGNALEDGDVLNPVVDRAGPYAIEVTDVSNGCVTVDVVEITENFVAPIVDAGEGIVLDCATTEFTVDGSASDQGPDYNYAWTTDDGNLGAVTDAIQAFANEPGTYLLTIQNVVNGCIESDAVVLTQNLFVPEITLPVPAVLNCYEPQQSLAATLSEPGDYSYEWSTNDGNIVDGVPTDEVLLNAPGNYTLTVFNNENSCETNASVNIVGDFDVPIASAGIPNTLTCQVTTINLDGNGSSAGTNFAYLWSTDDGNFLSGQNEIEPEVNAPGTYQLEVTNLDNGCQNTDEITVLQDVENPVVDPGGNGVINCYEPVFTLNGSASSSGNNFTYSWTSADGEILNGEGDAIASTAVPGTYNLLVTNTENGCSTSAPVLVIEDTDLSPLEILPLAELNCYNPAVTLQANPENAAGLIYTWTTPDGNLLSNPALENVTVDAEGTYEVNYFNAQNGCSDVVSITIAEDFENPLANAGADMEIDCEQTAVLLDGSVSSQGNNFAYQWFSPQGETLQDADEITLTVETPGTYELLVTNVTNGCTATSSVFVNDDTEHPEAFIATPETLTCANTILQLNATASQPAGEVDFSWTNEDGGIVSGFDSAMPQINKAGIYFLHVTDQNNGCVTTTTVEVPEDITPPEVKFATPDVLNCSVEQVTLQANVTAAGNDFSAAWLSADGNILSGNNSLTPLVDAPGSYLLEIFNPDNGCSSESNVEVFENIVLPEIVIEEPEELNCVTSEVELFTEVNATTDEVSFQWNGASLISPLGGANAVVNAPGNYTVTVTDDANNCTATREVIVMENTNAPTGLELLPQEPPCYDGVGHVAIQSVQGGEGPYVYSLDGGESFWSQEFFNEVELDPGEYEMIVQDVIGCEYAQEFILPNAPELAVELGADIELELGDNYQLDAKINFTEFLVESVRWTNAESLSCSDCLDPIARPVRNTSYEVTVTHANGCTVSDNVHIVLDDELPVFIPNAFSPNSDNNNDGFTIFAKEKQIEKINFLQIFDRWGAKVFENKNFPANSSDAGWDGTVDGETLNPGVFVYWTEIEFIDGTTQVFEGDVTLIR